MYNSDQLGQHFDLPPYSTLPDITQPDWDCEPFSMVRLGEQGQILYFTSVNHGAFPNEWYKLPNEWRNPHYAMVLRGIGEFEVLTRGTKRRLVVEGSIRPPQSSPANAYWSGGEGGLAAYYAQRLGYEQDCFEPPDGGTGYLLEQGFPRKIVAAFMFLRLVPSWYRRYETFYGHGLAAREFAAAPPPSFEEFATSRIKGQGNVTPPLAQFGYSYQDYVQLYREQYQTDFNPYDPKTIQLLRQETIGYMLAPRSTIHEAAIAVNGLRDQLLAKGLSELWQQGISAFVTFGVSHGLTLKGLIETWGSDFDAYIDKHSGKNRRFRVQEFRGMCSPAPGVIEPRTSGRRLLDGSAPTFDQKPNK